MAKKPRLISECHEYCEIRRKGREFMKLEGKAWEKGCKEGCDKMAELIKPYYEELRKRGR